MHKMRCLSRCPGQGYGVSSPPPPSLVQNTHCTRGQCSDQKSGGGGGIPDTPHTSGQRSDEKNAGGKEGGGGKGHPS